MLARHPARVSCPVECVAVFRLAPLTLERCRPWFGPDVRTRSRLSRASESGRPSRGAHRRACRSGGGPTKAERPGGTPGRCTGLEDALFLRRLLVLSRRLPRGGTLDADAPPLKVLLPSGLLFLNPLESLVNRFHGLP